MLIETGAFVLSKLVGQCPQFTPSGGEVYLDIIKSGAGVGNPSATMAPGSKPGILTIFSSGFIGQIPLAQGPNGGGSGIGLTISKI